LEQPTALSSETYQQNGRTAVGIGSDVGIGAIWLD
jgi:hypothetical protein